MTLNCFVHLIRGGKSEKTTAFIVKQREDEIAKLKEQLAELQRLMVSQSKAMSANNYNASSKKNSRSSSKTDAAAVPSISESGKKQLLSKYYLRSQYETIVYV